jgi:hypothetical protein
MSGPMDPVMIVTLARLAVELLPILIQLLEWLVPLVQEFFQGLSAREQSQLCQAWATVWGL